MVASGFPSKPLSSFWSEGLPPAYSIHWSGLPSWLVSRSWRAGFAGRPEPQEDVLPAVAVGVLLGVVGLARLVVDELVVAAVAVRVRVLLLHVLLLVEEQHDGGAFGCARSGRGRRGGRERRTAQAERRAVSERRASACAASQFGQFARFSSEGADEAVAGEAAHRGPMWSKGEAARSASTALWPTPQLRPDELDSLACPPGRA